MSTRNLIFLVLILVAAVLGFFLLTGPKILSPQENSPNKNQGVQVIASPSGEKTIEIKQNGFSPSVVTIKEAETVTWLNTNKEDHQVNSDLHPTHGLYPPLNAIGLLKPGEKKSLSFPSKGTYKFHDHLNPQFFGSITVE